MKKFLFVITFLFFASASFGQWSAGPRIGANFTTITGQWSDDDDVKNGWITAMAIGGVGSYEFTEMISLNAELLFITIGDKTKYSGIDEKSSMAEYEVTLKERYHYIQLPILVRINFGSNFLFFANFGPYCGYKVGGHFKAESSEGETAEGRLRFNEDKAEGNDWVYDPDYERRFDLGLYIGGGAGKKVGPGVIEADLRFGIGLLDHNKFEDKDYKKELKDHGYKAAKTMCVSLTVAYMFGFGQNQPARFID